MYEMKARVSPPLGRPKRQALVNVSRTGAGSASRAREGVATARTFQGIRVDHAGRSDTCWGVHGELSRCLPPSYSVRGHTCATEHCADSLANRGEEAYSVRRRDP